MEARFCLFMSKNSYSNLLIDHIDGVEFFWTFLDSSYLHLFQEGTTAEFPALGRGHNPLPETVWLFILDDNYFKQSM